MFSVLEVVEVCDDWMHEHMLWFVKDIRTRYKFGKDSQVQKMQYCNPWFV